MISPPLKSKTPERSENLFKYAVSSNLPEQMLETIKRALW
ncbi:hypothetical protein HMPREF0202_02792 [Cetobacterium somerae ATCC BAA-474]|uniref:Uncharacterized protein n=1 Tax=Cetobacterium somerae ATCC BAA-474 TaxID=1319815 RepID=U7V219_9FUSO|nr:hypothetical protein HMPREF0202_02792 [Cetobacterium somerae ATCC BAA-474]